MIKQQPDNQNVADLDAEGEGKLSLLHLRLDVPTRRAIRRVAALNERSMTGELRFAIRKHLIESGESL